MALLLPLTPPSCAYLLDPRSGVTGFDGLDAVVKCLFKNAFADGPEHESEKSVP